MALRAGLMLMPKLWYFFYFLSIGSFGPFLSLILKDKGFSPKEIGFITSVQCLINLVGAPLWGLLVDVTGCPRLTLSGSVVASLAALLLLELSHDRLFCIAFIVANYAFSAGHCGILDRCTMGYIKRAGFPQAYGQQRTWGAVGWGIAAAVSGKLQSLPGHEGYFWSNVLAAVFGGFFVVAVAASNMKLDQPGEHHMATMKELGQVLTARPLVMFFLVMMTVGGAFAVAGTFLFLYLEGLGASHVLLGLTITFTVLSEIPLFFFTSKLLEKIGVLGMLTIAVGAYALRFVGFCLLSNPWYVLIVEPLHGITYACFWTAGVSHISDVAPVGLETTAQGVLNGLTWGLGPLVGNLGGGFLFEHFGPVVLFAVGAVILITTHTLFVLTQRLCPPAEDQAPRAPNVALEKLLDEGFGDTASIVTDP
eukprot:EG_transcript_7633